MLAQRWMRGALLGTLGLLLSLAAAQAPARAIGISAEITPIGVDSYRATYSVHNDGSLGSGVPVLLFDLFFDPADYLESSLSIVSPASVTSEWDELLLASAPGVSAAYDALALGAGVPDGATSTGFAVEFQWLNAARLPGSQAFAIYDPDTFEPLETGDTVVVPEPRTLTLLGSCIAFLAASRRTRRMRSSAIHRGP